VSPCSKAKIEAVLYKAELPAATVWAMMEALEKMTDARRYEFAITLTKETELK